MTTRHYYHGPSGYIEITDHIDERGLEVRENAEEGSVAMSTILIDDPDMDLQLKGHRGYIIKEDSVPGGTEDRIFDGYTADRTYMRGRLPLGRQIRLTVTDINVVWGRRVMIGSDCKRPAETDVERMQWLITTAESGLIDDDTYLSTISPAAMDACDYRGQMMSQVADDCAQASGKNWYLTSLFVTGGGFAIWYGKEGLTTYTSDLALSNVLEDIDYETVFPFSEDAELAVDPSRVFSGVYLQREGGSNYRERSSTITEFARRDAVMPSLNVKTSAKAVARIERYLDDLDEEDIRFQCSVILPAEKVNMIRPGMRVAVRGSHFPADLLDPDTFYWMRVLWRSVKYWTPTDYAIVMELSPGVAAAGPVSCSLAIGSTAETHSGASASSGSGTEAVSNSLTASTAGLVIALPVGYDGDSPHATGMSAITGYTAVVTGEDWLSSTYSVGVKAVGAGATTSLAASYTKGFNGEDPWIAAQVLIPTSATGIVQHVTDPDGTQSHMALPSAPSAGSMLVACGWTEGDASMAAGSGWTFLSTASQSISGDRGITYGVLGHCVAEGEANDYTAFEKTSGAANALGCTIMEIVIS